jgi:hypothetical protein
MSVNYARIIAKKEFFKDWTSASQNPRVKYVLEFPYDYLLADYYDEVFEITHSSDDEIRKLIEIDALVRKKIESSILDEKELLTPLYSHPKAKSILSSNIALSIWTKMKRYHVYEPGNPNTINLSCWDVSCNTSKIQMSAKLKKGNSANYNLVEKVIADWYEWADGLNVINFASETSFIREIVELEIYFNDNNFDDYLAALAVMLYDTHKKTSLKSVVFSDLQTNIL